jgi:hypothetical protein
MNNTNIFYARPSKIYPNLKIYHLATLDLESCLFFNFSSDSEKISADDDDDAGLPDGVFSNQKSLFGHILECHKIDHVGIFCGHLEYFTTIWHVSWPFGVFCGSLVNFSPFWSVVPRKIWQPRDDDYESPLKSPSLIRSHK